MEGSSPKILSGSDSSLNDTKREKGLVWLEDEAGCDKVEQFRDEIMEKVSASLNPFNKRLQSVENSLHDIIK